MFTDNEVSTKGGNATRANDHKNVAAEIHRPEIYLSPVPFAETCPLKPVKAEVVLFASNNYKAYISTDMHLHKLTSPRM